jgi:methanogenic corrinoid protein MtbC1
MADAGQAAGRPSGESFDLSRVSLRALERHLSEDSVLVLAQEVIARLAVRPPPAPEAPAPPSPERIARLAAALIDPDGASALADMEAARADGATLEAVYVGYLSAAARLLGERWSADDVTFGEVTMAAGRILAIMRALAVGGTAGAPRPSRRVVFAPTPGDDHTLGVRMATDLFRAEGWDVELLLGLTHQDLVDAVAASDRRLVGLSASGRRAGPALARLIVALRVARPDAFLLISGPIVAEAEDFVAALGADAAAADVGAAMAAFDRLGWAGARAGGPA